MELHTAALLVYVTHNTLSLELIEIMLLIISRIVVVLPLPAGALTMKKFSIFLTTSTPPQYSKVMYPLIYYLVKQNT